MPLMMHFTGHYTRKVNTQIGFSTYRDDNGAWIHIIAPPDIDIHVELDDSSAREMGRQLINIGTPKELNI